MEAAQLNLNLQLGEEGREGGKGVGSGQRGAGKGRLSVEVVRPWSKCQFNVNKFILATNGNGNGRGHTECTVQEEAGSAGGVGEEHSHRALLDQAM